MPILFSWAEIKKDFNNSFLFVKTKKEIIIKEKKILKK